jgi:hypothetical protein
MAVVMGIFLPLAETVRRINQLHDLREFFNWFDDYILGGILLWAAYRVLKHRNRAALYLIAAWGIATGAVLLSFLGQFSYYNSPSGDPGIFSTTFVAIAKGVILAFMLVGLNKAIRAEGEGKG